MSCEPITVADLTPRQLSVASMLARGFLTKQIASELHVGERWVRNIVTSIAYRIGSDPTKDDRVLVALWYREQVPICLETVLQYGPPIRLMDSLAKAS